MGKEELKSPELARYLPELHDTLEAICGSPQFKTSPKSCEFLRYIVSHSLRGNPDELKERLIGMALLGRTADYDTGSDAGVRVRANDVRKRLNAYYAASGHDAAFTLELPAGSYIPRFFGLITSVAASPASDDNTASSPAEDQPLPPIPLQTLIIPTLVAIFLCTVCIRWQLAQEHPFTTFWQSALQDRHALLYVPASADAGSQDLISRESFEETAPLLRLAGEFHAGLRLARTAAPSLSADDVLVTIGPSSESGSAAASALSEDLRLVVENTPRGRQIVDRSRETPRVQVSGRAALLTITNGTRPSIQIDGTDADAVRSLIQQLCERDTFPENLTDSFQAGTVTQAVFPMSNGNELTILHEAFSSSGEAQMPGQ
jgi:hypothetical protein